MLCYEKYVQKDKKICRIKTSCGILQVNSKNYAAVNKHKNDMLTAA